MPLTSNRRVAMSELLAKIEPAARRNRETVFTASLAMFYVTKAVGLTCLAKKSINGKLTFVESTLGSVYNAILFIGLLGIGVASSVIITNVNLAFMGVISLMLSLLNMWAPILLSLCCIYGARNQKAVVDCVIQLIAVDEAMNSLNIFVPHEKNKKFVTRLTVTAIAILSAFIVSDSILLLFNDVLQSIYRDMFAECVVISLAFNAPRLINMAFGCKLVVWLLGLKQRYQLLNTYIDTITGNKQLGNIRKISEIHANLCRLSSKANATHSMQLLVAIAAYYLNILITVYSGVIISVFQQNNLGLGVLAVYVMYWLLWYVSTLLVLCKCCGEIGDEAHRTGMLVHRALGRTSDPDSRKQLMMFSNQLMHDKVQVTACQFFDVNLKLVASMAGAVATYLIILVQLEIADLNKRYNGVNGNFSAVADKNKF